MSNKSCDCYSEAEADTFYDSLFNAMLYGGKLALITYTTFYLVAKTIKHSGEIKDLFSRLEKCEKIMKSSQEHELKK